MSKQEPVSARVEIWALVDSDNVVLLTSRHRGNLSVESVYRPGTRVVRLVEQPDA